MEENLSERHVVTKKTTVAELHAFSQLNQKRNRIVESFSLSENRKNTSVQWKQIFSYSSF